MGISWLRCVDAKMRWTKEHIAGDDDETGQGILCGPLSNPADSVSICSHSPQSPRVTGRRRRTSSTAATSPSMTLSRLPERWLSSRSPRTLPVPSRRSSALPSPLAAPLTADPLTTSLRPSTPARLRSTSKHLALLTRILLSSHPSAPPSKAFARSLRMHRQAYTFFLF